MTIVRAAWVCPIDAPPIEDGWVAAERGRVIAVGGAGTAGAERMAAAGAGEIRDLGRVALMPGLVNAHVHLEMSWLRGRVPPAGDFLQWVTRMLALRRRPERRGDPEVEQAAAAAAREMAATGTVAVGDTSNSLTAVDALVGAGLRGVVFHELIGFAERDDRLVRETRALRASARRDGIEVSVAPHAPYSVSVELFQAIRTHVNASAVRRTSMHLGESPEELQLLASGAGPWRTVLEAVGAWRDDWAPPGTGPVEYLDRLGVIDEGTLVAHGVQLGDESLARLAELGATLVTCPRSNEWVGVGAPPIERFHRSGVALAVGTDSLASVGDLNLFSELAAMRRLAPSVPARTLLQSATLVGARALGLDDDFGTVAPGKRSTLVAVELPAAVSDVEEYLVGGIDESRIARVEV